MEDKQFYKIYEDLGFERIDMDDAVLYRVTGYSGYILSKRINENAVIEVASDFLDRPKLYIAKEGDYNTAKAIELSIEDVENLFYKLEREEIVDASTHMSEDVFHEFMRKVSNGEFYPQIVGEEREEFDSEKLGVFDDEDDSVDTSDLVASILTRYGKENDPEWAHVVSGLVQDVVDNKVDNLEEEELDSLSEVQKFLEFIQQVVEVFDLDTDFGKYITLLERIEILKLLQDSIEYLRHVKLATEEDSPIEEALERIQLNLLDVWDTIN